MTRTRCERCPVPAGSPCLGETEAFGYMCGFAASDDPVRVRHVVERSAIGLDTQPAAPVEPPSLIAKAVSFAGAVTRHVAAGMPTVSDEVKAARLAICQSNECGRYRDDPDGPACLACGCAAKGLETKAGWAEQRCPLDPPRWDAAEPT